MSIKILEFNQMNFKYGLQIYKKDGVIIYPTDTVYGVGGNPFSTDVVKRIIRLKGRVNKPFPILIDNIDRAIKIAEIDNKTILLMKLLWPGPLTIVIQSKVDIPASLGSDTVGLRIPNDKILLDFINNIGGYLIGTSANPSGLQPATTVNEAVAYFKNYIDLYYDGGTRNRSPSTVIKICKDRIKILRIGQYPINQLKNILNKCGFEVVQ